MKLVTRKLILFFCILSACSRQDALPETSPTLTTLAPTVTATLLPTPSPTAQLANDNTREVLPEASPTLTNPAPTVTATLLPTPSPTVHLADNNVQEWFIVWGQEVSPDGECRIWILNPANQSEPIHTLIGKQDCNYTVVEVNGKEYLASLPHWNPAYIENPAEIALYDVTGDGTLISQQKIPLGDIRLVSLTSVPQWAADGSVYFAGILNGKEQIFRYDGHTETIESYLDSPDGFNTSPLLSPDGRYLAYTRVEDNAQNYEECIMACSNHFYHVWDIVNGRDIELLPLIEPWLADAPLYMHCELEWSPTSRFVAFDVGCGLQSPRSVAIIDIENAVPVEVINAPDYIRKAEWLPGDRLILSGERMTFASTDIPYEGYLLYPASTRAWIPLENIPERNIYNYDSVSFTDWTEDGAFVVGQTHAPLEKSTISTIDLVIFEVEDKENEGQYIRVLNEFVDSRSLLWSASNNFISYRSYNWESRNSQSRFTIISPTGETLLDTGMINVVSPKFTWFTKS
jgi:hypothetical protein